MGLLMQEDDVIELMKDFLSKKFPKECFCCGKHYDSFSEYLRNTKQVGSLRSYDVTKEDRFPDKPIGTVSFSNCSCGSTLTLTSNGMRVETLWRVMNWIRKEAKVRGAAISETLDSLRNKIDVSVLKDDDKNC
jgi:hypothetical protein